jgi:hypothetical protein
MFRFSSVQILACAVALKCLKAGIAHVLEERQRPNNADDSNAEPCRYWCIWSSFVSCERYMGIAQVLKRVDSAGGRVRDRIDTGVYYCSNMP